MSEVTKEDIEKYLENVEVVTKKKTEEKINKYMEVKESDEISFDVDMFDDL